jgi:accessory gene regulator protein AgrB
MVLICYVVIYTSQNITFQNKDLIKHFVINKLEYWKYYPHPCFRQSQVAQTGLELELLILLLHPEGDIPFLG